MKVDIISIEQMWKYMYVGNATLSKNRDHFYNTGIRTI